MSDVIIPYRFLWRGGTAAAVGALNEVVRYREAEAEFDTGRFKFGDGVTAYASLLYAGIGYSDLTGLSDGDVLIWDAAAGNWIVGPQSGGGGGTSPAMQFDADTGSTADSDPGAGLVKWNNATQGSATFIYMDDQTSDGVSLTAMWPELRIGGFLYLQHATDQDTWQIWEITAVTDATGYVKLAVLLIANGGSFADADPMLVTIQNGRGTAAGDVVGPASSVNDRIALFDGTTGKLLKDSGAVLSSYAPLASPTFTGTPAAPTPSNGDASTKIATTDFVATAVANGPGGTGNWTMIKKTSDESRNTTTTLSNDSTFSLALSATTRYNVRGKLYFILANANMDFKYGFNYTGTTTSAYTRRAFIAPNSSGAGGESQATFALLLPTEAITTGTNGGLGYLEYDLVIVTNSSGTLSVQWAQNTSDAGNLTVLGGSYLEYIAI